MNIYENNGYKYALKCSKARQGGKIPKYIIKQAKAWVKIADGKSRKAYVDSAEADRINNIMSLMVHPDLKCRLNDGIEDYAMWLIIAVFCTKVRGTDQRLYTTAVLEIARKNFKTFNAAVIFIIALLLEPRFSRLFSVAPDFKLSNELRLAVRKIIKCSPLLCDHFKVNRDYILCRITDNEYMPLAFSNDNLDGRLAAVWLADEACNMSAYPIQAMRSSQITLVNKLGIIISTQYPNDSNGFEKEVDVAKKTLDGALRMDNVFALLYEPDEEIRSDWKKDNNCIYQANPAAVHLKSVFDEVCKLRTMAILYEGEQQNFLCKHLNIPFKGLGAEGYISVEKVRRCRAKTPIDWTGRHIYNGIDLSQTTDNTAVATVAYDADNDIILARVKGFVPAGRIAEKTEKEKFDYQRCIRAGGCIACGDEVIDYSVVEEYMLNMEDELNAEITGQGFDRYNAMSTMQKLENAGLPCTEVKQHSSVLHPATKLLREYILQGKFIYDTNTLLENNFSNARCTYDTNLNMYVNKKKSNGKVDMVVALINAVYMMMQCEMVGNSDFVL